MGSGLGCGRARNYSLRCTRTVGTVPAPDAPRRWADCTIPSYRRCPADEEPPTSRRYLASTPETPRSGDPEGFCLTFGGPPKENGKNRQPDFSRTRIWPYATLRRSFSIRTLIRAPNPQAQSDAANTAEQAPAAAADAQLLQRSEAIIATRPNLPCTDAVSLHGQPFVGKPDGTAAGIQKLADRLLAGMLLAALRPAHSRAAPYYHLAATPYRLKLPAHRATRPWL